MLIVFVIVIYLVDLHVGLSVDDAVKVSRAQAVRLLEPPVLCTTAAAAGSVIGIWRQPRRHGHAHRLLLAQLVQVGQRTHRRRTDCLTRVRIDTVHVSHILTRGPYTDGGRNNKGNDGTIARLLRLFQI